MWHGLKAGSRPRRRRVAAGAISWVSVSSSRRLLRADDARTTCDSGSGAGSNLGEGGAAGFRIESGLEEWTLAVVVEEVAL